MQTSNLTYRDIYIKNVWDTVYLEQKLSGYGILYLPPPLLIRPHYHSILD